VYAAGVCACGADLLVCVYVAGVYVCGADCVGLGSSACVIVVARAAHMAALMPY